MAGIRIEQHRAQRFPFVAGIHLTSLDAEDHIAAHTEDLSLFGCFVETTTPFGEGTKVALRISHDGSIFVAEGRVIYSRSGAGMGIRFATIESSNASILDSWLSELRK